MTRFLYDGDALVAEYDSAGAMTRRYVHWDGADVPIISYAGATLTTPTYLHADHQGSIVAISDASGVTQINRYDEYGIPADTNAGRFQYTGQIWLAELGMYYYKARMYSPTLGRFLQTDPVGYAGGINLYAYVGDDPPNLVDPWGQAPGDPYLTSMDAAVDWENVNNRTSISRNREYVGAVYERGGRYYNTRGVPRSAKGGRADIRIPGGSRHVEDVHTHGDYSRETPTGQVIRTGRLGDRFDSDNPSPFDREQADSSRRPVTIGTPSGDYKRYDPATQNVETIQPYVPAIAPPPPPPPPAPAIRLPCRVGGPC